MAKHCVTCFTFHGAFFCAYYPFFENNIAVSENDFIQISCGSLFTSTARIKLNTNDFEPLFWLFFYSYTAK